MTQLKFNSYGLRDLNLSVDPALERKLCFFYRFMDGNFGIAPQGLDFQQLYVIRGNLAQTAVTLVYILMQRLDQEAYTETFQAIQQQCTNRNIAVNPTNLMMDFELAAWNAASIVFPQAVISGCFYHLCQVRKTSYLLQYHYSDIIQL